VVGSSLLSKSKNTYFHYETLHPFSACNIYAQDTVYSLYSLLHISHETGGSLPFRGQWPHACHQNVVPLEGSGEYLATYGCIWLYLCRLKVNIAFSFTFTSFTFMIFWPIAILICARKSCDIWNYIKMIFPFYIII